MAIIKKAQKGKEVFKKNKPLMDSLSKENMKVLDTTYKAKPAVAKAKDGKWIQKATASIKKRGTKGVCTGSKFGGPTCKPGSKRYNLAKTFKAMSKKK
jgi:hypothetical protein